MHINQYRLGLWIKGIKDGEVSEQRDVTGGLAHYVLSLMLMPMLMHATVIDQPRMQVY